MVSVSDGVPAPIQNRLNDPREMEPRHYLNVVQGGETALHIYLKDDKEWWLAHNPDHDVVGTLNGPWLMWSTYPSGGWQLNYCTRSLMMHHVGELYYVNYDGEQAHSVHELTATTISDAPEFVRAEFNRIEEP